MHAFKLLLIPTMSHSGDEYIHSMFLTSEFSPVSPANEVGGGNIFTRVCQSFCPVDVYPSMHLGRAGLSQHAPGQRGCVNGVHGKGGVWTGGVNRGVWTGGVWTVRVQPLRWPSCILLEYILVCPS